MTQDTTEQVTWTWHKAEPVITKEQAQNITSRATIFKRFLLLFKKSRYSFDQGAIIRYKEMGGTHYVMKRGTRL